MGQPMGQPKGLPHGLPHGLPLVATNRLVSRSIGTRDPRLRCYDTGNLNTECPMSHQARHQIPGQPQHVIQRGNNRGAIFAVRADAEFYLGRLRGAARKFGCDIHAYMLMTNHVHLLVTPRAEGGIGRMMQSVGGSYTFYVNETYERTGTLWEGRYRSAAIDSERYLLTCMRYIELNPVRAGLVTRPENHPYSSYRANAFGEDNPLVVSHDVYGTLGQSRDERLEAYRALFATEITPREVQVLRGTPGAAHGAAQGAAPWAAPVVDLALFPTSGTQFAPRDSRQGAWLTSGLRGLIPGQTPSRAPSPPHHRHAP